MTALVAKSYQGYEQLSDSFVENGKEYIKVKIPCDRCGGKGYSDNPAWVVNGSTCFKCHGKGREIKTVRVYNEKEYERMEALKALRAEKAEEERREKSLQKKRDLPKKLGFAGIETEPHIYVVLGDTYSIKDTLKELGARYHGGFGWYFEGTAEVPVEYNCFILFWEDVINTYGELKNNEEIKQYIKEQTTEPSKSEFQGIVGQKIDKDVTVWRVIDFSGRYGVSHMHIFQDVGENVYVWTTTTKKLPQGDVIRLTGTIKDHKEYNEVKQTILTRCKIL